MRLSLATAYRLDERWTLRGGLAYERSAIPDEFRTPRIPDNAHTLLGAGFNYRISNAASIDVGYMHAFVKDAPVNVTTPTAGTLAGDYKVRADVLSVQYNHSF